MTYDQRHWEDAAIGDTFSGFSLPLTFTKVALTPTATWDFFPGHHDPNYARAQGQRDIYLNTIALQGFADRVVTDWAGPKTFIARRKMAMTGSVFPGDVLSGAGEVAGKFEENGQGRVLILLSLATEAGVVCKVETTAVLPSRRE